MVTDVKGHIKMSTNPIKIKHA